jgi:hypothetical protein
MPRSDPPASDEEDDLGEADGAPELHEGDLESPEGEDAPGSSELARRRGLPRGVKIAGGLLAIAVAVAAVFVYRHHQERRILALSIARAQQLVRSDTWLGYHEAAQLLGVRAVQIDPLEAGSLRAFALAMLAADYRDEDAVPQANLALTEALRAPQVPDYANMAMAALAIHDGQAGTALAYASRGGEGALAQVLQARVTLLAGNATAARDALDRALRIDPELPAARALQADLLRRAGRDGEARESYVTALSASAAALSAGLAGSTGREGATAPHPRATYGLAKLALSRALGSEDVTHALQRLLEDRKGSPGVERARAALYLAALQGRAGDRPAVTATIDKAGLDGALRAWLERAAGRIEVERGRYTVPEGTPPPLMSASDDDPYVPPPPPPKVEPAPPKKVIYGFKVHPPSKPAPKRTIKATRAKAKAKLKSKAKRTKAKPTKKAKKKTRRSVDLP